MDRGISFWLMPAAQDYAFYQRTIAQLADNANAAYLEPHVTLYVGVLDEEDPLAILQRVAAQAQPITLHVADIVSEAAFGHSFYLRMKTQPSLSQWCETFRQSFRQPSDYQLNPHLSLFYKADAMEEKRRISKTLDFVGKTISFDRIQVVIHPEVITEPQHIAAFKTLESCALVEC